MAASTAEGMSQAARELPLSTSYIPNGDPGPYGGGTYTTYPNEPTLRDYENVFGPSARDIKDDLQKYKRHGRWHLPDILQGPNPWLADRIDGLITDATNSPFTSVILPYRYFENVDGKIKWNVWSFDEGMASRVPYESAARTLTQSKRSYAGYAVRHGLAINLEHNFMMTPKGRENFQNQLNQLIGSIQYSNDLDVHVALLLAPSHEKIMREKYAHADEPAVQVCRQFVDLFGFLQKNQNALDIMIEEAKYRLKNWGGPMPNFMLCNSKLTFQLTMIPDKTNYVSQGPDGQKRLKQGPELASYRGLNIIHTRSFSMETGQPPRDMLRRRVRVAEYYRIAPHKDNHKRDFEFYNEARDTWFTMSFKDLLKAARYNKSRTQHPKYKGEVQPGSRNHKLIEQLVEWLEGQQDAPAHGALVAGTAREAGLRGATNRGFLGPQALSGEDYVKQFKRLVAMGTRFTEGGETANVNLLAQVLSVPAADMFPGLVLAPLSADLLFHQELPGGLEQLQVQIPGLQFITMYPWFDGNLLTPITDREIPQFYHKNVPVSFDRNPDAFLNAACVAKRLQSRYHIPIELVKTISTGAVIKFNYLHARNPGASILQPLGAFKEPNSFAWKIDRGLSADEDVKNAHLDLYLTSDLVNLLLKPHNDHSGTVIAVINGDDAMVNRMWSLVVTARKHAGTIGEFSLEFNRNMIKFLQDTIKSSSEESLVDNQLIWTWPDDSLLTIDDMNHPDLKYSHAFLQQKTFLGGKRHIPRHFSLGILGELIETFNTPLKPASSSVSDRSASEFCTWLHTRLTGDAFGRLPHDVKQTLMLNALNKINDIETEEGLVKYDFRDPPQFTPPPETEQSSVIVHALVAAVTPRGDGQPSGDAPRGSHWRHPEGYDERDERHGSRGGREGHDYRQGGYGSRGGREGYDDRQGGYGSRGHGEGYGGTEDRDGEEYGDPEDGDGSRGGGDRPRAGGMPDELAMQLLARTEIVVVRPNIEHYMLGIIMGLAGEQLGSTLWGQTELSVYDDSMHGIWGMSYKYHERAIVFNEKNLVRLWDVAYDGYNGGKDDTYVDWTSPKAVDRFATATVDPTKNYNGQSMMVMAFVHAPLPAQIMYKSDNDKQYDPFRHDFQRNWPSPILFHDGYDYENQGPDSTAPTPLAVGYDNTHVVDVNEFRVFDKPLYAAYKYYLGLMPNFRELHQMRKNAGQSSHEGDTPYDSLAFQGSMKIKLNGSLQEDILGSGHHGPDFVGVASVRAGKGYKIVSQPSLQRTV